MSDDKFEDRVFAIVTDIEYKDHYHLICARDRKDPEGRVFIQVACWRKDTVTGEMGMGKGGKSYLSEHMTDSEIVRRAFGLFMAYEEHECREFFKWRGRRVFGPHIAVEALWEAAKQVDVRAT